MVRLEGIAGVRLRDLVSGAPELSMQRLLHDAELTAQLDTVDWIGTQVGRSKNT